MNLTETIAIFALLVLGSISIIVWLVNGVILFNTIGIVLIGVGLGWFFGLRALNV